MSFFIQYTPTLMKRLGSDRSAILFERLEYWFKRYSSGFYKFITICKHPCYREGDSWAEELGFSRDIFNRAFDRIGIRYKSKTDFESQQDPFKGKYFAMYMDRQTHRTYFVRNHRALEVLSKDIKLSAPAVAKTFKKQKSSAPIVSERQHKFNSRNSTKQNSNIFRKQKLTSSSFKEKDELFNKNKNSSFTEFHESSSEISYERRVQSKPSSKAEYYPHSILEESTFSNAKKDQNKYVHNSKDISLEMLKIWTNLIGEIGGNISPHSSTIQRRLMAILDQFFKGSLKLWLSYCRKIASSKFLMGEGRNQSFKKAWLLWAIKPDTINRIQQGDFVTGDRIIPESESIKNLKQSLAYLRREASMINLALKALEQDRKNALERCVRNLKQNLKTEQIEILKYQFVRELKEHKPILYSEFQLHGWEGNCLDILFDFFLQAKLDRLVPQEYEQIEIMLDQKQTVLKSKLSQLTVQRDTLTEQLRDMELTMNYEAAGEIVLCA
jgi:hypothetical protein